MWERYKERSPYSQVAAPHEQIQDVKNQRESILNAKVALEAAYEVAKDDIPFYAWEGVEQWLEHRERMFNLMAATEGVEYTSLAFGGVEEKDRRLFSEGITNLARWLEDNNHPNLNPEDQRIVQAINDFMKQHFAWVAEYGVGMTSIHSPTVIEVTSDLIDAAMKWTELEEFQNQDSEAFDASATLKRMHQTLKTLPKEQQSAFRRKAVSEIRRSWRNQLVNAASLIESTFKTIASEHAAYFPEKIEQLTTQVASSLKLTPEQRHELRRSAALLIQRLHDRNKFLEVARAEAREKSTDLAVQIVEDLFGYTPEHGASYVHTDGPLAIQISPNSKAEYDRLYQGEQNSGGFFSVKRSKRLGVNVPVIIISPGYSSTDKTKAHERTHAACDMMFKSSEEWDLDDPFFARRTDRKSEAERLNQIIKRGPLRRAKDEIIVYLYEGIPLKSFFGGIKEILTEDPLYDYIRKYWHHWGVRDNQMYQQTKTSYNQQVSRAIQTAVIVEKELDLKREQLAALLAILPMDLWSHLLWPRNNYTVKFWKRFLRLKS